MKQSFEQKIVLNEFAKDVLEGFSDEKKHLSAKYFYDRKGSELFNQITRHPDYYLTQCEIEILNTHKKEVSQLFNKEHFNLIELGPGEGIKTQIILEQLVKDSRDFNYIAIDISQKYLNQIQTQIEKYMHPSKIKMLNSDYFQGLDWVKNNSKRRNLVLFLGSSIGNFDTENTKNFLRQVWSNLRDGDYFLIGFDLRKDTEVLIKAYNDKDGITKEFNLNLLSRINRELKGNFDISCFNHFATYDVYTGAMESYLISFKKHEVYIGILNESFNFHEYEPIHVEYSYKFLVSQVEEYAANCGFEVIHHFLDKKEYFLNSLWKVRKK